jgi:hypothetical protein
MASTRARVSASSVVLGFGNLSLVKSIFLMSLSCLNDDGFLIDDDGHAHALDVRKVLDIECFLPDQVCELLREVVDRIELDVPVDIALLDDDGHGCVSCVDV